MIPFLHLGPLRLGTYGLMVWAGLVCGFLALQADMRRRKLPGDTLNMILLIALAGLAGSKLYHLLERPSEFFAHPLQMFFSASGFAWFGGLLGGLLVIVLFSLRYRIAILTLLDACSPAAAIGYGVGRIGCLLSGDGDYGIPTSLPWCMSFPNGLVPTTQCVHPTPIYEFLGAVVIFLWLWRQAKSSAAGARAPGWVLGQYFVLTGLARFLVEFIRINPRVWLGLSNAQLAGTCSVMVGIVLLLLTRRASPGSS
ncbi:MAG TPA: prolipoprotein diacylglyceryl transferase family protein [Terriglobales bacterium]|nr:prolipoprotein diacylglyceryl transferase family protein [Terriglobales bacterium]